MGRADHPLDATKSMTDVGGTTFVNPDNGDSIALSGIAISQLSAADFSFI